MSAKSEEIREAVERMDLDERAKAEILRCKVEAAKASGEANAALLRDDLLAAEREFARAVMVMHTWRTHRLLTEEADRG